MILNINTLETDCQIISVHFSTETNLLELFLVHFLTETNLRLIFIIFPTTYPQASERVMYFIKASVSNQFISKLFSFYRLSDSFKTKFLAKRRDYSSCNTEFKNTQNSQYLTNIFFN
jgi:hypothetical protein